MKHCIEMSAILETKHLGEKIFLLSLASLIILLSADYKYLFLPINGIWLLLYILLISVATIWATFTCVQKLLQQTVPLNYDNIENDSAILHRLQILFAYLKPSIMEVQKGEKEHPQTLPKSIDNRIDDLANDIEARFIAKWYDNITKDNTFKTETRQLLEMVIRRFLQVVIHVDSKRIAIGSLSIILKHLKEYRKTLKRVERNGGNVETLYRYTHVASKSPKALEHFLHKLTGNLVREFISWELCNSLPCRLLVAILAKKVATYLLISISEPGRFNYNVVTLCAPNKSLELKLNQFAYISLSDVDLSGNLEQLKKFGADEEPPKSVDKPSSPKIEGARHDNKKANAVSRDDPNTPKISPKKKVCKQDDLMNADQVDSCNVTKRSVSQQYQDKDSKGIETVYTSTTRPIDIVGSVAGTKFNSEGDPYKPRHSEAVKIYEPRPTSKTWRDSSDLDCISLGQDLLDLQGEPAEAGESNSTTTAGSTIGLPIAGAVPAAAPGMELPISSFIERKLWGDTESLGSDKSLPKQHHPMWDINESWLGEEEGLPGPYRDATDGDEALLGHVAKKGKGLGVSPSGSTHSLASRAGPTSASNIISNTVGNVTASTLHNMKELQKSTVNNVVKPVSQATTNAMHKIEDFQDEAAGVMEGILDFGIAGLRKGLRLTGLQDIHSELQGGNASKQSKQQDPHPTTRALHSQTEANSGVKSSKANVKLIKVGHVTSEDVAKGGVLGPEKVTTGNPADPDDSVWMNPLNKDSPGSFDGHILLETSTASTTTTSIPISYSAELNRLKENVNEMINVDSAESKTDEVAKGKINPATIPHISTEYDSVDDASQIVDSPEYEEAADLESTIIKLRSLLQQRSSESSLNTPAISPMPLDDPKMMCTTPVDLVECTKADGTMPSLYKLCAKTATGVFNTVKNVLPGNATEQGNGGHEKWLFIENEVQANDLMVLMEGLLVERRDFCTVDTAYEAMDSADLLTESASSQQSWNLNLAAEAGGVTGDAAAVGGGYADDETDDLEAAIPITKSLMDIVCECLGDTDTVLIREPIVKAALVLGGNGCEEYIESALKRFVRQISKYVDALPRNENNLPKAMDLREFVEGIVEELPGLVKTVVGENNLKEALSFLFASLQSQQINQDIMVQLFELISAQIIVASNLMSPTPSA